MAHCSFPHVVMMKGYSIDMCHECAWARVFCLQLNVLAVPRCMRSSLFHRTWMWCLHVKLVSEARGAWASGAAENLSPSCQAAFKVFSSCSSGCSQPRPHPHVSRCYVTVPAGRTKGTHGDSDRHWMIQSGRTEGLKELGRKGGMEGKKERAGGERQRSAWVIIHMYYFTVNWRIKKT